MILSLEIKNYRSYKDKVIFSMEASSSKSKDFNYTEISKYKILRTALMYGANASGKSNIIKALFELRNLIIFKPKVEDKILLDDPFKFNEDNLNQPVEFELDFLINQIKHKYSFSILHNNIVSEKLLYFPSFREVLIFERNKMNTESTVQSGVLGNEFGKKEINVFKNQLILSKFGDDEPHEFISEIYLYFKNMFVFNSTNKIHYEVLNDKVSNDLIGDKELKKRLEILLQIADTKINSLDIKKQVENIIDKSEYFWKKNDFYILGNHDYYKGNKKTGEVGLSLLEESIGTQSLYALGTKILQAIEQGSVIVIDELDTSLHSFITKMLVSLFQNETINKKNSQLIFTTHDISLLDKDLIRKDQVWITEKNNKGESDLYSLQDFEGLREDTSFDRWYLSGKFGGIPQIKSLQDHFE